MNDIDQHKQIARHLAARALVALRANFRVERIAIVDGMSTQAESLVTGPRPGNLIGTI